MIRFRHLAAMLAAAGLAACATPAATTPTAERDLSPGVAWVASSQGWADEAEAVYDEATAYVEQVAASRPEGSWAVALDIDETVLNNVEYQVRLEESGATYTPESWHAWTGEKAATLVPGAKEFLERVNALGGHIALVTNRADSEQLWTEENLAQVGLTRPDDFRILMTRAYPEGASNKMPRYAIIPAMLGAQGYPDVEVVAYVGDNVGDKPDTPGDWEFFCIDQGAMYGEPCAAVPGPGR
ncbi:HAD family acid phosphatase [Henriciella aquimarina]|uniref:HAD family acid phosphatase n=1 Tax=Henriciella aquimarina TaxID=545261 RepID=UPI001301BE98|nr:HAD family acid phosphatase [Henriciella aquimarina]